MSVSQINAATTETVALTKKTDVIDVPFDIAFKNLKVIAEITSGQWIDVSLATKLITVRSYLSTYFYGPDVNFSIVEASLKSVLSVLEQEESHKASVICMHENVANGFTTLSETFKKYPTLSSEMTRMATIWNEKKPSERQVKAAHYKLVLQTLKAIPRKYAAKETPTIGISPIMLNESERFKGARAASEKYVVEEKNYPRDIFKKHMPQPLKARAQSTQVVVPMRPSMDGRFCKQLMERRAAIVGKN